MTKALYELRKFIPTLLMPFGLSLVLIALGLLLRRRIVALAGLLLLFLASLPAVSDSLCFALENQYPHLQAAQSPTADVVVALGGCAGEKKRFPGEIQWYDSVDRFEGAVQLFRLHKAPIILFAEAKPLTDDWRTNMEALLRQAAVEHGVPKDTVRFTRPAATMAEEAEAVEEYLEQTRGHRVILVTSAFHMEQIQFLLGHVSIQTTERYLGCTQRMSSAVKDRIGIEPAP